MKIDILKPADRIALLKNKKRASHGLIKKQNKKPKASPKCLGYYDYYGEFDCGYQTSTLCEDCKYGACGGRKDPEAKCNQL